MNVFVKPVLWFVTAGVLGVGSAGFQLSRSDSKSEQFLTAGVVEGRIEETVAALGNIQPLRFVDVGTQVTGQLRAVHFEVGQLVNKGDLVAEIDPTLFSSRVGVTRATLDNLQAQLADRQAQEKLARLQHRRNEELFLINAVSAEALEQSSAGLEQSAAQVRGLRAQIEQVRATLAGDEANLRYTRIYAPMTGTVVSVNAREGQTLVASQQAPVILRIADLATMTVWAQVSEADVPKIAIGMPVYFNTLGQPDRRWKGKVRQILPTPEVVNNVVLYNVLFDVGNPDQALKTQMSAQVYFLVASADGAVLIPSAALQSRADEESAPRERTAKAEAGADPEILALRPRSYSVQVYKGGKVEVRKVKVGVKNRSQAQVLAGLQPGEEVVIGGAANRGKGDKGKRLPFPTSLR